ncbi:MAG: DUF1934 domain-containing protein [Clostridium sp.]|jgi:hypothetical protein|nr:DUF1934 domain-containing protein [Clostridium sp.]
MGKKAIISVISNANIEEDDMIEVVSPGSFEKIEDGFKATYEETEISGMEGTTTILTIKENQVILEREGTTSTKMIFKEDEDSIVLYNTPYGMLEIAISTNNLDVKIDEDGGKLDIEYEMSVYGQPPFNTKLSLSIKVQE